MKTQVDPMKTQVDTTALLTLMEHWQSMAKKTRESAELYMNRSDFRESSRLNAIATAQLCCASDLEALITQKQNGE